MIMPVEIGVNLMLFHLNVTLYCINNVMHYVYHKIIAAEEMLMPGSGMMLTPDDISCSKQGLSIHYYYANNNIIIK